MSKDSQDQRTFFELYLTGEASAEDIDDYIDKWHAGAGRDPIYEFLGFSREEYSAWMRDPALLPHIARARREHEDSAETMDPKP
ncbi:MAG: hypothetical protein ACREQ4_02280 [Candidatus Binataceae bacterium]